MKLLLFFICICCIWGIMPWYGCSSNPSEEANRLFQVAEQEIKSGKESEASSYSTAYEHYRSAMGTLEKIRSKYSSTEIGASLLNQKTKIDSYTLTEFKENVYPLAKKKARVEANPGKCAFLIIKTMRDTSFKDSTLKNIAVKFARTGQFDESLKVVDIIENDFIRTSTLCELTGIYDKSGQSEKTGKLLMTISDNVTKISDPYCNSKILSEIATISMGIEKNEKVLNTLAQAHDHSKKIASIYSRVLILSELALKYADLGQQTKSFSFLQEAQDLAEKIDTRHLQAKILADIAKTYITLEQKEKAAKIIDLALKTANKSADTARKIESLNAVALILIHMGDKNQVTKIIKQAMDLSNNIKNIEDKNRVLANISATCAKNGNFDKSLEIAGSLDIHQSRASAFSEITSLYLEKKQYDNAIKSVSKAIEAAKNIKETVFKNLALFEICNLLSQTGEYEKAFQLAKTIKSTTIIN